MMDRPRAGRAGAALRAGLLVIGMVRMVTGGAAVPPLDRIGPLAAEIGSTNAPPIANDDRASIDAGEAVDDGAPGLLFNDVDPDGDPLVAMRHSGPVNGTAIVRRDGSWSYTPAPGFAGTDTFTYVVSDGLLTSAPATVTVTVRGPAVVTPVPSVAPSTAPSASPSPSPSPTPVPAASSPPPPAGGPVFSIPEPPASTLHLDDIGIEATKVAGLGPVMWAAPSVLLGVPGLLLVLSVVRRRGRSRELAKRAASRQTGAATRS